MSNDERLYTYWFIYLIPEYLQKKYITDLVQDDESMVYAYTDKKELLRLWKEQRNSKIFFIEKRKITKGMVNYLASNFPNEYLQPFEGKTRTEDGELRHYKLAITINERNGITGDAAFYIQTNLRRNRKWLPYIVYRPIIRSALNVLLYDLAIFPDTVPDECYEIIDDYDFLYVFIRKYGPLLKQK